MKKFYFLFLFALIASIGNLYAAEKTVTFDAKVDRSSSTTLLKDGITLSLSGGGTFDNGTDYRPYAGSTLTISSEYNITKIVFTCASKVGATKGGPENFTVTKGGGSYKNDKGYVGTWTGSAASITFKAGKQVKAKTIEVTYDAPAETKCATPTFNLENGKTYTDAQTLVITSTTADATIHYTINGGEEKTGQPAAFTENGQYIVNAWAKKDGLTDSEHAPITFTIAKKMNKPTFNLTEGAVYGEAKVLEITSDKVGAQIEYTVVGGGNISITKTEASPVNVTLDQNGEYTVEASVLEMDDYAKSDAAGLNFKIELAAGVPTFSVEEGTYPEAQTIALAPGEGGEKVFYTINDGTEQQYIEPIKLEEEGIYKIAAYTAATETLAKSASVTKTYIINFPLDEPYILCENAAWLTEGTKIIFVGEKNNKYYGLSGDADGVFLTGGLVTISAKELTEKDVTVKVFVVGRTANGVTFNTDAGYLAADKTASKGNLSYAAGNEGDCFHWTVSVANGEATVVNADVTGDCNNLQFNPSAKTPRFGAYADSYKNGNLSIYLLGSTSSVSSMSAEGVKVFAAEGGVEVVADEAADVAVYTVAGQLVRQARVAEGSTLVNVAPGFYVVRANGTATKVIVR
jgi:hypothetical protein